MRRFFMFLIITLITAMVLTITMQYDISLPNEVARYYSESAFRDTGAQNAVTAIYLNYRVYDTLFEALMLLISILAVIYFSRHEEQDYEI